MGRLATGLCALLLLACAGAPLQDQPAPRPLRILLTNDDGVRAPGLRALHQALVAEGHEVVVVAPLRDRSGSGASLTTGGSLSLREVAPGFHAVDGTPSDAVRLAFVAVLDEPVDLVVSGVNFGQNVGASTINSGTVGAAITAAALGVPAVAVSQAVEPSDVDETARYFPDAAAFAVEVVAELSRRTPVLPTGIVLNVNHPARHRGQVAGVRLTRQGRSRLYDLGYQPAGPGRFEVGFVPSEEVESVRNADTTALAAGYATITPLDGTLTASGARLTGFAPLVERLGLRERAATH